MYWNLLSQAMRPTRLKVMIRKAWSRIHDKTGKLELEQYRQWLSDSVVDFEQIAAQLDERLWKESKSVSRALEDRAEVILKSLPVKLGGGGIYPFLYFLTRYKRPSIIVETGVAAGYSSWSFLKGIEANRTGHLYSSDFPYFRLDKPEQYIGCLVEDSMKAYWTLLVEGDRHNLPIITKEVNQIEIAHYDSDKSYSGREYFIDLIMPKMSDNGIILMDDIQDNSFFYDYIVNRPEVRYSIFTFGDKYIGMIGSL